MAAAAAAFLLLPNATPKPALPSTKPLISLPTTRLSFNLVPYRPPPPPPPPPLAAQERFRFWPCSAAQDIAVEEETKGSEEGSYDEAEKKQKIYVVNLPWSYSAPDIEKLFGECGTVKKVEIIREKNGKSRGFAFVTMDSREEAHAAIQKFNSYELLGRIIRVELSKSFRKPSPPPPPGATMVEIRHKIHASNLAWKLRSINLRDFFSAKFKPLSARVVLSNPAGRCAGYGFVSFATKEEADAAISELDGKTRPDDYIASTCAGPKRPDDYIASTCTRPKRPDYFFFVIIFVLIKLEKY